MQKLHVTYDSGYVKRSKQQQKYTYEENKPRRKQTIQLITFMLEY